MTLEHSAPDNAPAPDTAADHAAGALQLDGDRAKVTSYYREWAAEYDDDMSTEGYLGPMITAGLGAMVVAAEGPDSVLDVLDAGCGTGLVGRVLHQRRPGVRITGVDLSPEMAAVAEQRGGYAEVRGGVDLFEYARGGESFPLVLCSGTLTTGHVGINGLDALLDLTSPGGHLAFSVRRTHSLEEDYAGRIGALVRDGVVTIVSELSNAPYLDNGGADYWLLRKAG